MRRGREQSRYPNEHITRDRLGPHEAVRATVLDRDERTCLACYPGFTSEVPVRVVLALATDDAEGHPLFLRTFCHAHAAVIEEDTEHPGRRRDQLALGWRIPLVDDPIGYASRLPVFYPRGRWFVLDDWGERRQVTDAEAERLRREIRST